MAIIVKGTQEAKKVIKLVDKWTTQNFMALNKQKCGILQLSNRGNTFTKQEKELANIEGIPFVKQYKYLGITFNKSLSA